MKTKKQIFDWLHANCGPKCLAPLTSHDVDALLASVALCPFINHEHAPRPLFAAYGAVVAEMQPQTRWLAYHAIAMELDWSDRRRIWTQAGLSEGDLPAHKAAFEPGGAARI